MSRYRGPRMRVLKRLGSITGIPGFGRKHNQKYREKFREIEKKKKFQLRNRKKTRSRKKKFGSVPSFPIRLQEKQKLRYHYGLTEKNLKKYVQQAQQKNKRLSTTGLFKNVKVRLANTAGILLLKDLEMRLDNIVFRLGLAPSLPAARQYVTHGHILVNGKKRDRPSSQCQVNDLIKISLDPIKKQQKTTKLPYFLSFDSENFTGKILRQASRKEIGLTINELLVIEYYSRS